MTKSERRKHPRVSWRRPATYLSDPQGLLRHSQSIEADNVGNLVRGPIPLEAGSGLELRIDMGELRLAPVDPTVEGLGSSSPGAESEV